MSASVVVTELEPSEEVDTVPSECSAAKKVYQLTLSWDIDS